MHGDIERGAYVVRIAAGRILKLDAAVLVMPALGDIGARENLQYANVCYQLKTPYRDGITDVILQSLEFIARLTVLVPKPRINVARFHGVFAPNSRLRARVTPGKRGKNCPHLTTCDPEEPTPAERRAWLTWAQLLKRVFGIDIETCPACDGAVRIIARIDDPEVI